MISRFWFRFCVSALFCVALTGVAAAHHGHSHQQASVQGFDGTYRVEIRTTDGHGSCAPSYSGTITVQNFRVVAFSDPQATAAGGILDDGTVSLALRRNDQVANVGGKIKGHIGKGFWSSPTAFCGGLWHAERED
jgi:hypothetical protein